MLELANELAYVQEKVNQAFQGLKTHSVNEVWEPVSSAIDKCGHISAPERQWMQHLIYTRLDEMKCQAYGRVPINVAYIVHEQLPKLQNCCPPSGLERVISVR
jgi:hypothetical protein